MISGMSRLGYKLSCLAHPCLTPVAAKRGDSAAVFALAKRIDLTRWLDPPREGLLQIEHSLSWRHLASWDKATIKLEIAKFLLDKHRSLLPSTGVLPVTIFGTRGRETDSKSAYTENYITGFKYRERQFDFAEHLHFTQGSGIELELD